MIVRIGKEVPLMAGVNTITATVVLALGKKMGLKMVEAKIMLDALYRADEIFLTGTTVEVLPVTHVNKKGLYNKLCLI